MARGFPDSFGRSSLISLVLSIFLPRAIYDPNLSLVLEITCLTAD